MILIADSGATKSDWIALDENGNQLFFTQTLGLSPEVLTRDVIEDRLANNFELSKNAEKVTQVYFYGAGCGTDRMKVFLSDIFKEFFPNAKSEIREDTYAAVYATTQPNEPAIVCIMGTGSNCTYYDGEEIEQRITSLGYVLMDEASGNFYGKQLIRSYYFKTMPKELAEKFENQYDLSADVIKENVYRKENPNTYLANFAQFIIENKEVPQMRTLIDDGLQRFISHQILQFKDATAIPIHLVGSIAFYLKSEINEALNKNGLTMGNVVKRPIDGLVLYHQKLLHN